MEFDIVVATRNRQPALALSLPLMLAQSRLLAVFRATRCISPFFRAAPEEAAGTYATLREKCLDGR